MAGRKYDAAGGLFEYYGHLNSRGGTESQVYHIKTECVEGADNYALHHLAADPAVTAYDDLFVAGFFLQYAAKSGSKTDNIQRTQCFAGFSADGTADAGNALDQCHETGFKTAQT